MEMRWIAMPLCSALLLAGCATPLRQPGATFDRAAQALKDASASGKRAGDDAIAQAMLPSLDLETPKSAANTEPHFDLAVNGAPAAQVFGAIVSGTRYSMVVPPEISGSITLNLKNVTVREALETIRDVYGYEFTIKGTRIFVQPNTMQTRVMQINYLAGRRQGLTDTRITASSPSIVNPNGTSGGTTSMPTAQPTTQQGLQPGQMAAVGSDSARVQTRSDADFWKELGNALDAIVGSGDGRTVIVSPHSGVVLIKAMPAEIHAVENYLKATQLAVERQVMLEAKIVDVQLNEGYSTGINWANFGGAGRRFGYGVAAPGTTLNTSGSITGNANGVNGSTSTTAVVAPGAGGAIATTAIGQGFFGLALQTTNFAALLNFLETQGDAQVLSSPRLATINNQKAVLKVGTDDYYVTNISTTTNASGSSTVTSPSITLQPFFSGVALDVTPQIDDEGNVLLHVHPSVSVVAEKSKTIDLGSLGTFTLPLASSTINETDAVVRVQDGYIVAIGGLMSQNQSRDNNGLPGLSSAPGIGALFGQRAGSLQKRELVVLIKPTVINTEASWKQDLADSASRLQSLDPRPLPPRAQ